MAKVEREILGVILMSCTTQLLSSAQPGNHTEINLHYQTIHIYNDNAETMVKMERGKSMCDFYVLHNSAQPPHNHTEINLHFQTVHIYYDDAETMVKVERKILCVILMFCTAHLLSSASPHIFTR